MPTFTNAAVFVLTVVGDSVVQDPGSITLSITCTIPLLAGTEPMIVASLIMIFPSFTLIFALLHQQYGPSLITVGAFASGIIFGLARKHLGTVPAIITHALYNIIAVLLLL